MKQWEERNWYGHRIHTIYLAGKVAMDNDWREDILKYDPAYYSALESDRGHAHKSRLGGVVYDPTASIGPDTDLEHWPVRKNAIFGWWDYTGPYVSDMGHGQNAFCWGDDAEQKHVVQECIEAIRRSDVVFAWLDNVTAYGTIAEIGYAKALGKRVWIAGPVEYGDLWFTYHMADRVSIGATDPISALRAMLFTVRTSTGQDDGSNWEGAE